MRNESNLRLIFKYKMHLDGSKYLSRSVENLSARQKVAQWIKEAVEHLSRRNPEVSMDRDFDKIYQEKKKEGLDRREFVEDLSRSCRA